MSKTNDLELQIKHAESELDVMKDELRRSIEAENTELSPVRELAVALHDARCKQDHTEQCGWFYEISNKKHDWTKLTHSEWFRKADIVNQRLDTLLGNPSKDTKIQLIKII